jgi:Rrf2 family protein
LPIISKKSRCAFHGLAYLAGSSNGLPVPFDEILEYITHHSSGPALSAGYIAKIFQSVSRAGIVEAVPGPSGGYRLARAPSEIPLLAVVEALDGPLVSRREATAGNPRDEVSSCSVDEFIRQCEGNVHESLEKSSVASLTPKKPVLRARG